MKAIPYVTRGFHLSGSKDNLETSLRHHAPPHVLAGLSGALLLCWTGWASDRVVSLSPPDSQGLPDEVRLNLGTVGIKEDNTPAAFRFETGSGIIESKGERASRYARDTLNTTGNTQESALILSPVTLVAAPFAALAGVVSPNREMNASQMTAAQLDLTAAMERASHQERFREEVIRAAQETGGRNLVGLGQARGDPERVKTVLETRIEQISLERIGKGEKSFALKIKTSNRLVRASDGQVLYDQPMEYCSGTDLFIEWTRASAIDSVMQTGMRKLARKTASEMLSLYDTPVLAGTATAGNSAKPAVAVTPVKFASFAPAPARGLIQVADTGSDALGIFSTTQMARVAVQSISEEEPETPVAVQQTEWMLDEMNAHPNYGVSLPAIAVAVPISIGNQFIEAIKRLSPDTVRQANDNLSRAARADRLEEQVALELAQHLAPQTAMPIVLVDGPIPPAGGLSLPEPGANAPGMQFVSKRSNANRFAGLAIQVRVTHAALTGKGELNPRLSLSVKGQADLVRISDGTRVYSVPMEYSSKPHRFTQWAAHDADLFRKELKTGYQELGKALADHLVTRGIVPAEKSRSSFLALK